MLDAFEPRIFLHWHVFQWGPPKRGKLVEGQLEGVVTEIVL